MRLVEVAWHDRHHRAAHSGVCVDDCDAAVAFYLDALGMTVLSPPYVMDNDAIRDDTFELLPDPRMKAAIVGFGTDGDRARDDRVPRRSVGCGFHPGRENHARAALLLAMGLVLRTSLRHGQSTRVECAVYRNLGE
jgi:hypothetical protein